MERAAASEEQELLQSEIRMRHTNRARVAGQALTPPGIEVNLPWEREEGELEWLCLVSTWEPQCNPGPAEILEFYGFSEYQFAIDMSKDVCPNASRLLEHVLSMIDKVSGSQIPAGPLGSLLHSEILQASKDGASCPMLLLPAKDLGRIAREAEATSGDCTAQTTTTGEDNTTSGWEPHWSMPNAGEQQKAQRSFLLDLIVACRFYPELLPLVEGAHNPAGTLFAERLQAVHSSPALLAQRLADALLYTSSCQRFAAGCRSKFLRSEHPEGWLRQEFVESLLFRMSNNRLILTLSWLEAPHTQQAVGDAALSLLSSLCAHPHAGMHPRHTGARCHEEVPPASKSTRAASNNSPAVQHEDSEEGAQWLAWEAGRGNALGLRGAHGMSQLLNGLAHAVLVVASCGGARSGDGELLVEEQTGSEERETTAETDAGSDVVQPSKLEAQPNTDQQGGQSVVGRGRGERSGTGSGMGAVKGAGPLSGAWGALVGGGARWSGGGDALASPKRLPRPPLYDACEKGGERQRGGKKAQAASWIRTWTEMSEKWDTRTAWPMSVADWLHRSHHHDATALLLSSTPAPSPAAPLFPTLLRGCAVGSVSLGGWERLCESLVALPWPAVVPTRRELTEHMRRDMQHARCALALCRGWGGLSVWWMAYSSRTRAYTRIAAPRDQGSPPLHGDLSIELRGAVKEWVQGIKEVWAAAVARVKEEEEEGEGQRQADAGSGEGVRDAEAAEKGDRNGRATADGGDQNGDILSVGAGLLLCLTAPHRTRGRVAEEGMERLKEAIAARLAATQPEAERTDGSSCDAEETTQDGDARGAAGRDCLSVLGAVMRVVDGDAGSSVHLRGCLCQQQQPADAAGKQPAVTNSTVLIGEDCVRCLRGSLSQAYAAEIAPLRDQQAREHRCYAHMRKFLQTLYASPGRSWVALGEVLAAVRDGGRLEEMAEEQVEERLLAILAKEHAGTRWRGRGDRREFRMGTPLERVTKHVQWLLWEGLEEGGESKPLQQLLETKGCVPVSLLLSSDRRLAILAREAVAAEPSGVRAVGSQSPSEADSESGQASDTCGDLSQGTRKIVGRERSGSPTDLSGRKGGKEGLEETVLRASEGAVGLTVTEGDSEMEVGREDVLSVIRGLMRTAAEEEQDEESALFEDGLPAAGGAQRSLSDVDDGDAAEAVARSGGVRALLLREGFRTLSPTAIEMVAQAMNVEGGGYKPRRQICGEAQVRCRSMLSEQNRAWVDASGMPSAGMHAADFVCATFNILAGDLAVPKRYRLSTEEELAWAVRCDRIVADLTASGADVMCLQEVQSSLNPLDGGGNHLADLERRMRVCGFDLAYGRKAVRANGRAIGNAIVEPVSGETVQSTVSDAASDPADAPNDKLERGSLTVADDQKGHPSSKGGGGGGSVQAWGDGGGELSGQVLTVVRLRRVDDGARLCVGSLCGSSTLQLTRILRLHKHCCCDIGSSRRQKMQVSHAVSMLRRLAGDESFVLGVDMNLHPGHCTPLLQTLPGVHSAYATVLGTEPSFTVWDKGCGQGAEFVNTLDYLLFSSHSDGAGGLACVSVLNEPDPIPEHVRERGMPSGAFPSDHMMLAARFTMPLRTQDEPQRATA